MSGFGTSQLDQGHHQNKYQKQQQQLTNHIDHAPDRYIL